MLLRQLRRVSPPPSLIAERVSASPGDDGEAAAAGASIDDDAAVAAHERTALAEIDATLHLLETDPDRFGICSVCGERIEPTRLRMVPTTRFCGRHAPSR
jgi:RNA polymerase-binding transcription factor DksA